MRKKLELKQVPAINQMLSRVSLKQVSDMLGFKGKGTAGIRRAIDALGLDIVYTLVPRKDYSNDKNS